MLVLIFLLPICGLGISFLINTLLPKAQFSGSDLLPIFFLPACSYITKMQHRPSFLPYGFLFFFILVVWITAEAAIKNKNLSLTIHYDGIKTSIKFIFFEVFLFFNPKV